MVASTAVGTTTLPFGIGGTAAANPADDEKIWTKVLSDVSAKASNTLQGGTVVVLGDSQTGKSSLLAKLERSDNTRPSSALEYQILNVQNDFRDSSYAYQLGTAGMGTENLVLPVWTLDGNETFAPLLKHALPSTSPARVVVLLCSSIDNPSLIHSLRRWANIFSQQVVKKYDKAVIDDAKKQQERYWQEYEEPMECSMTASMAVTGEESTLLPLEKGVLVDNSGANVVVVITKSELGINLTEQQADRILVQVRQFCLQLGAALVYTSANNVKNIQLLYKYIVHRAFGLPFAQPAQLLERDSLFVPAGWDGQKKIDIIKEGVPDVDVPLEPTRDKTTLLREQIIEAEEEQAFLKRLLDLENSAPAPTKKAPLVDEATDSSSPLASFFSNLLKDKPGNPGSGASPRTSMAPQDVQVQLDRLMNQVQPGAGSDSSA